MSLLVGQRSSTCPSGCVASWSATAPGAHELGDRTSFWQSAGGHPGELLRIAALLSGAPPGALAVGGRGRIETDWREMWPGR